METNEVILAAGAPFSGRSLESLKRFLEMQELTYDENIEYTVNLLDEDYGIIGTGSLDGNILKCIAVDEKYQGQGLLAKILTALIGHASKKGVNKLFLFTKPKNLAMFREFGFYTIAMTGSVLLMENDRGGIRGYIEEIKDETKRKMGTEKAGNIGAIIVNCNPFTYGHQYLMETAAAICDRLHVFVVSNDKSDFPSDVRLELVKKGTAHIDNIVIHETKDYLISAATFPTYFIKDKVKAEEVNCRLDIEIFLKYVVKELGISKRIVGTEPYCRVTNYYNSQMREMLGENGVEFVEIPRKKEKDDAISASLVRTYIAEGKWEELKGLVPPTTYQYITSKEADGINARIRAKHQEKTDIRRPISS